MGNILTSFVLVLFAVCEVSAMGDKNKTAEVQQDHLNVSKPWSRATNGKSGAIFLTLTAPKKVALVKASSNVSEVVELHTHIKEGDVMKMRAVEKFDVTPGKPKVLKPGEDHIMLINLHKPLVENDEIPLELTFDDGSIINITVPVRKAGAMTPCGCCGGKKK